ncbi:MAG: amino acid ABC transporter permease [Treponema sp.]|jgi:polar amino acid transport system permease protein|nr:amino acid ABC transporter permease [Treponema sp.]MBQ1971036.1 amino acid ABC transporter permease [Treponema sp.]MBQ5631814.1 amino acid ABC transporter permease [Treponema sp.]MBQ5646280.1 amino acid ABC transporter permease [Treponema sp.]MBQ5847971.1 amino acid ABC transporter permease [Treponema sp.]
MNGINYSKMLKAMLQGSVTSLEVFFLTLLFAIPLALPIAMGRMSKNKILSGSTNVFLLIIRGTPLMLQLLVVYFGPGLFFNWLRSFGYDVNIRWERFPAAIVALSINYAAYFAEIYRGGIESIPKGQYEAAKVLGYTSGQTFFRIVLPQVVKRIIPAMGNEVITLVKDTALVSVIGVAELLLVAKERQSALFSFVPLFIAGVFYFIMNWGVSVAFAKIEKKLSYYN